MNFLSKELGMDITSEKMEPKTLKENFVSQLEKIEREVTQLQAALKQRQDYSIKLRGAIEAMQLQMGEQPGEQNEEVSVVEEVLNPEQSQEN